MLPQVIKILTAQKTFEPFELFDIDVIPMIIPPVSLERTIPLSHHHVSRTAFQKSNKELENQTS